MQRILTTVLTLIALWAFTASSGAQAIAPADEQQFKSVISDQLSAFSADDGAKAYSHAAPIIQGVFPTPEAFMGMVMKGYQPVYRSKSHEFGQSFTDNLGRPAQRVLITAMDGKRYEAVYTMERQADGTWKIAGCYLVQIPALDV